MANTGIDASRDVTLTRQSNGTYTLTLPIDVYKRQVLVSLPSTASHLLTTMMHALP